MAVLRVGSLLTVLAALIGCDASLPEAAPSPDTAGASLDAVPAVAAGPADRAAPEAASNSGAGAALAVEGEGLRVFFRDSGAARPFPFGTDRNAVRSVVIAVLGASPAQEGESADCGAGFASWESGLTLWFTDRDFVGWSLRAGDGAITTASGIGPGSTRAEVEKSYAIEIRPSSLGVEFTAGSLAGLFASSDPDAPVLNLWAGQSCIAR